MEINSGTLDAIRVEFKRRIEEERLILSQGMARGHTSFESYREAVGKNFGLMKSQQIMDDILKEVYEHE